MSKQARYWTEFLKRINNDSTGASAREFLFGIAAEKVVARAQKALKTIEDKLRVDRAALATTPSDDLLCETVENGEKARLTQMQLLTNSQEMRARGAHGGSYADDEYVQLILDSFGVPYTLVTEQVTETSTGAESVYIVWKKEVNEPVLQHHRHALRCSGFDQNNATAAQAHWDSGLAAPEELGFDLSNQSTWIDEQPPFCQWNNTPADGNCTIHAIYEVLSAAAEEASQILGITVSTSTTPVSTSTPVTSVTSPSKTTGNNPHQSIPETRQLLDNWLKTDEMIRMAAKNYLEQLEMDELKRLAKTIAGKYPAIQCIRFDESHSKIDYARGIATLMQAMNHHTHLSNPNSLVHHELDQIRQGNLSKDGIFAAIECSDTAQVNPAVTAG